LSSFWMSFYCFLLFFIVLAFNGQTWRLIGRTTGMLSTTKAIVKSTANTKDYAKAMGLSDAELDVIARKLNDMPCPI